MSPQVAPATLVSPVACSYVFSFSAKPAAFIRTLNALESCERFITVDDFSFVRPSDVIAESLGGDEKKASETQASGRRGRRGRRGGGEEAPASKLAGTEEGKEGRNRIVTDPLLDAPMTVTMTVTARTTATMPCSRLSNLDFGDGSHASFYRVRRDDESGALNDIWPPRLVV